MVFKLSASQEDYLQNKPETGMGYQIIEASRQGSYKTEKFIALNSEIVIEMNGYETDNIRYVMSKGMFVAKSDASIITLNKLFVLNEYQFRRKTTHFKEEWYSLLMEKGAVEKKHILQ